MKFPHKRGEVTKNGVGSPKRAANVTKFVKMKKSKNR
jgi:hypothetical protein